MSQCTCTGENAINAEISLFLPNSDDVNIIIGPPEHMNEGQFFHCDAIATAAGVVTISGTGEALEALMEQSLSIDVDLHDPGEGVAVVCRGETAIDNDTYGTVRLTLEVDAAGAIAGDISFVERERDGGGEQPTLQVHTCAVTNWEKQP